MKKEIRIHGRGGQGVVALAEILAIAFFITEKKSKPFLILVWREAEPQFNLLSEYLISPY